MKRDKLARRFTDTEFIRVVKSERAVKQEMIARALEMVQRRGDDALVKKPTPRSGNL